MSERRPRSVATDRAGGLSVLLLVGVLAGCSIGGPILANPPAVRPEPPATPATSGAPSDPQPVVFPRDDGPHHRLTEWWYYTGHLLADDGRRFGFEFVVFRAERVGFPVSWASHLALTDETAGRFHYAQRSEIGPQVDRSPLAEGVPAGFAFAISGGGARVTGSSAASSASSWTMDGGPTEDRLVAAASAIETANGAGSFAFDLSLARGPVALHEHDGFVDFGVAGGSYYYSRPREPLMRGTVTVGGRTVPVRGEAWFDHQWGDFIAVGGGGWDWFAINLSDGRAVTLSLVRDATGNAALVYGTLLAGRASHLTQNDFAVQVTARWRSPHSAANYPAGWRISIPRLGLVFDLTPTVADQELDTRATSGVVYWEGSQRVTVHGMPGLQPGPGARGLSAEAYVELTGYASVSAPTSSGSPLP